MALERGAALILPLALLLVFIFRARSEGRTGLTADEVEVLLIVNVCGLCMHSWFERSRIRREIKKHEESKR